MNETPPAVLARLEAELREEARQCGTGFQDYDASAFNAWADELATLRASLAQQGEAVAWEMTYPRAIDTISFLNAPEFVRSETRAKQIAERYRDNFGEAATYRPLFTHPAAVDEAMVERLAVWFTRHATVQIRNGENTTADDYREHARAALTAAFQPATEGEK